MGTNLKDVYFCQMNRTTELSKKMSNRNIPSHQMGASYFGRPVDTYATLFPILDCHLPKVMSQLNFLFMINIICLILDRVHHLMVFQKM